MITRQAVVDEFRTMLDSLSEVAGYMNIGQIHKITEASAGVMSRELAAEVR